MGIGSGEEHSYTLYPQRAAFNWNMLNGCYEWGLLQGECNGEEIWESCTVRDRGSPNIPGHSALKLLDNAIAHTALQT